MLGANFLGGSFTFAGGSDLVTGSSLACDEVNVVSGSFLGGGTTFAGSYGGAVAIF
jgi:hypothetical protein